MTVKTRASPQAGSLRIELPVVWVSRKKHQTTEINEYMKLKNLTREEVSSISEISGLELGIQYNLEIIEIGIFNELLKGPLFIGSCLVSLKKLYNKTNLKLMTGPHSNFYSSLVLPKKTFQNTSFLSRGESNEMQE